VSSDYCYEGADGALIIYPVTITPTPPGTYAMIISYSIDKTYNDVVTALNAWAVANLSAGVAPICDLTNPADGSIVPLGIAVYLTNDAVPEQLIFSVQLISGQFDGSLNGPF
jgi:ubiquitin C-terminal hydrolase